MSVTNVENQPDIRQITATAKRVGAMKNEHHVRHFSFLIDEPLKLGGTDQAPTPMEYVLGAFNGCILIVIETIAKEIGFVFTGLQAESTAALDRRGLFGTAAVSPHFLEVVNTINFESTESLARLEELKEKVLQRCPAYNLFNDANIKITLDWKLVRGEGE